MQGDAMSECKYKQLLVNLLYAISEEISEGSWIDIEHSKKTTQAIMVAQEALSKEYTF